MGLKNTELLTLISDDLLKGTGMHDKLALTTNPAGMRLIAQMTLYNASNWERLHRYIADSYADALLIAASVKDRLGVFTADQQTLGRLKVGQVLALDKYHVVVLMQSEVGEVLQIHDLTVEEEHPHKITDYKRYAIA